MAAGCVVIFDADPDDAPCDRCGAPVHLPHDPPTPCGRVLCPEHDPCCTDEEDACNVR